MAQDLTEQDVRRVVEAKLGHSNFTVDDFKLEDATNLSFHSDNNILIVNARIENRQERCVFFFKTVDVNNEVFKRYLGPNRIFEKEHAILTEVIPELQKTASRKITAKCYLSKVLKFVVLEDLTLSGFRPCMEVLDEEHSKLALSAFANYHAASIAQEEKLGVKLGEKYKHTLYESLIISRDEPEESLMASLDAQLRSLCQKYFNHIDSETQNDVIIQIRRSAMELQRPSFKYRNVITHGDAWGNNVLYKYDENKPVDAILVDFQTVRHAPPAQDLNMFFYVAGPNSKFITNHMSELTDYYYEQLGQYLSEQGLEISRILPKADFLASCEDYRAFGISLRVYYTMVTGLPLDLLIRASENPKIFCDLMVGSKTDLIFEAYENYPEFKKSLDEAIECAFDYYKKM